MAASSFGGPKLFGMIALSLGIVTKEQLEECLSIQQESSICRRLGAIMLVKGYMNDAQVREVLHVQNRVRLRAKRNNSDSEKRRLIGQILLERGYVNREILTNSLYRQQNLRKEGFNFRLGEILVASGNISPGQLKEALAVQNSL